MGDLIVTQPWSSGQVVTPSGLNEFLSSAKIAPNAVTESQLAAPPTPFGYLSGLTMSYLDGSNISIAPGLARDDQDTVSIKLTAPITKKLDGWSVGTGRGAIDAGPIYGEKWYHVFVIYKQNHPIDVLFSTSATSPTLPQGFINKRRIGTILINSSGQIVPFQQYGDSFYFTDYVTEMVQQALPNGTRLMRLKVPSGIRVMPICYIQSDGALNVSPAEGIGSVSNMSLHPWSAFSVNLSVWTNEKQEIVVGSNAVSKLSIWTSGWIDPRGK